MNRLTLTRVCLGALFILLVGCSGPQQRPDADTVYLDPVPVAELGPSLSGLEEGPDAAWLAWFEGRTEAAEPLLMTGSEPGPLELFGQAEMSRQRGDLSRALSAHSQLLRRFPGDPLARFSALRIHEMREFMGNLAVEFSEGFLLDPAIWPKFALETQVYLSRLGAFRAVREGRRRADVRTDTLTWGRPSKWRWVGPFAFADTAAFDDPVPAEEDDVLASSYTLGERHLETRSGIYHENIAPAWPSGGVYILESFVEVPKATRAIAVLATLSRAELMIDDAPVLDYDIRDGFPPMTQARIVHLEPGRHRLRVKYGASQRAPSFEVMLIPIDRAQTLSEAEPGATSGAQVGSRLAFYGGLPEDLVEIAADPFALWLASTYAQAVGDHARTRKAAELGAPLFKDFVPMLQLDASRMRADPGLDPSIGLSEAFARYARILEIDPEAGLAHLGRLQLYLAEEQIEDALAESERLLETSPDLFIAHYFRYLLLNALGWEAVAKDALEEAQRVDPRSCEIAALRLEATHTAGRPITPDDVEEPVRGCARVQVLLAGAYHVPRGEHAEARAIIEGLLERFPDEPDLVDQLTSQLLALDEHDAAIALLDDVEQLDMGFFEATRRHVDLLYSLGRKDEAQRRLEAVLDEHPSALSLIEMRRVFGGERILADLRIDGLEVVQEYLSGTRTYTQSAFYLLDYAAFRYFEDGSALSVTHQILQVRNKDGIDQFGEIRVPDDAIITELRTIKSDGVTVIEPESIPHKRSISMPNLAPGDFIEIEYLQASGANADNAPRFVAPRWFFRIPEAALMYSEIIFEVPAGIDPQIDLRGDVPQPEVTQREGFTRYRYLMTEMLPPRTEPNAPLQVEIVPSVQFGNGYGYEDYRLLYQNDLLALTVPTPYLREAYAEAVQGAVDPDAITHRVFRFLEQRIVDDSGSPFEKPASWIWTSGAGSRLLLLKTLLDIGGVPNELMLVKPFGAPERDSAVPQLRYYGQPVLRVDVGDDRPLWLDPSRTHAKYNYVPPMLQGQPAISLDTGEFDTVARFDPELDQSTIQLDLRFDESGGMAGTGVDITDGIRGTNVRQYYEGNIDNALQIRRDLSAQVSRFFLGAEVVDFDFEGVDGEGPVSVRYDFVSPGAARVDGDELLFRTQFFPQELLARFGASASREHPLIINTPLRSHLDVTMTLPEGWTPERLPEPLSFQTPFGTYLRELTVEGRTVTLVERVQIPKQRVAPEDYAAFKDFAQKVDAAQVLLLLARKR